MQKQSPSAEPRVAADIIRDLAPLNRVFASPDYDRAIDYMCALLPFELHRYEADDEFNGWVIPPRWRPIKATITDVARGELVWDGLRHPLAVISISASFRGRIGREELLRHLHYDHRFADAIPYHFRQQYRSWERDWGFCIPKSLYESLGPGEYDVVIETEEGPGDLKVLEHVHAGQTEHSVALVAHLDHPGMANDDLAGCAVGIEVFRRLAGRKTKFTYRLLLVQEIIGSVYWWARTNEGNKAHIFDSLFLEMLGSETELALQSSLRGPSEMEEAVATALSSQGQPHRRGAFGTIVVNDEYVWESYGIPMASLSRFPYPEYHTDRDNAAIISEDALETAVGVVVEAIERLETVTIARRTFEGTVCLSNPRYDLYVDPGQPAFGETASQDVRRLRILADTIPTLEHPISVRAIAARTEVDELVALEYLRRWASRGLVELV